MMQRPVLHRALSRAAANLVAVAAITAIFGLKAYVDQQTGAGLRAQPAEPALYEAYLTEQP